MSDRYRFKERLKQHRDKKRSKFTSGIIGGEMLVGGAFVRQFVGYKFLGLFSVPAWLAELPCVSLVITNPLPLLAVAAAVVTSPLIIKIVNDKKNNKLVSEFCSYTGTLSANAKKGAQIVYIPVIFFLKRMGQLEYQTPEIVLGLTKTYGFEEADANSFVTEYGSKSEDELKDIMGRLDPQEEGLEDLSFLVAVAIQECKKFRNSISQEKSKADACIQEIEACLCKGIDWSRLESAFIIMLVSTVIPVIIFLRDNSDKKKLSETDLRDELRNLGLQDEDLEKKLISKYSVKEIREEQKTLIKILANNLVHDPGTIASKQELYSLPKTIVSSAKKVCLELNKKYFEERLHPRNEEYIEKECSKLKKLICKELRDYSAEVAALVQQSAEVNGQVVKDLNEFVDGLEKFTMEREQEQEQMLCEVERELRDMMESTGIKTAANTKVFRDTCSQLDKLLSR